MRKAFIVLASMILVLGAFMLEGGALRTLMIATAVIPILLGSLISTWFSYSMAEIGNAFNDAFAERVDLDKLGRYRISLLVIRNMQASVLYWSLTIIVLAVIGILCSLTDVHRLGPAVAAGTVSLLLGFALRAVLLTPMENSLVKKLSLTEELVAQPKQF